VAEPNPSGGGCAGQVWERQEVVKGSCHVSVFSAQFAMRRKPGLRADRPTEN
jgi:hypothetical protein